MTTDKDGDSLPRVEELYVQSGLAMLLFFLTSVKVFHSNVSFQYEYVSKFRGLMQACNMDVALSPLFFLFLYFFLGSR